MAEAQPAVAYRRGSAEAIFTAADVDRALQAWRVGEFSAFGLCIALRHAGVAALIDRIKATLCRSQPLAMSMDEKPETHNLSVATRISLALDIFGTCALWERRSGGEEVRVYLRDAGD